jgi:hypothetical protein
MNFMNAGPTVNAIDYQRRTPESLREICENEMLELVLDTA